MQKYYELEKRRDTLRKKKHHLDRILKNLKEERDKLVTQAALYKDDVIEVDENYERIQDRCDEINQNLLPKQRDKVRKIQEQLQQISDMLQPEVTDHAVLRYIQRVMDKPLIGNLNQKRDQVILENTLEEHDIDDRKIRSIIRDEVSELVEKLGNDGKYTFKKGYQAIVKDNSVVSIIEK